MSQAKNVTYLPRPVEFNGMMTFRADSDYYFNGKPRRRPAVLVIAAVLALFVLIATVFIGGMAANSWVRFAGLVTEGEVATATYTYKDTEIIGPVSDSSRRYFFAYNYTVNGVTYTGDHTVNQIRYTFFFEPGGTLDVIYDRSDPANSQPGRIPSPVLALLQSCLAVVILVGGGGLALATTGDFYRKYKPTQDGVVVRGEVTGIVPGAEGVTVTFGYTDPRTNESASGTATLPTQLMGALREGLPVGVLVINQVQRLL